MSTGRDNPKPYGSANDLPSVVEMRQRLAGGKFITRLIAREQRSQLVKLERDLDALVALVDRFYALLGPRHWIFTGHLPVPELERTLDANPSAAEAEAALVEIFGARVRGPYWEMGLLWHEAMRPRLRTLERARQHYIDGQWDSCALLLVTAMDGFVNDVEPAERRGLHTREPNEMVAWDSVVGHHMGLTSVMPVFLKTFKRRHDTEVFELHRHGIVHGTVVNYDNPIVATKAWNMLAATCDWAEAKLKAATPEEPKPTFRSTLASLADAAKRQQYRETFKPSRVEVNDATFDELPLAREATRFLESWATGRWAHVADYLPSFLFERDSTPGQRAADAKNIYASSPLVEFAIVGVSFPQASMGVVHGTATIGERTGPIEIRWILEASDGNVAMPGDNGARWTLAVYPPHTFMA